MMVTYPIHIPLGHDVKVLERRMTQAIQDIKEWAERGLTDANFNPEHMLCGLQNGKLVINKKFNRNVLIIQYYKSKAYRSDQLICEVLIDDAGEYKTQTTAKHELEEHDLEQIDMDVIQEIHKRKEVYMREARFMMWLEFNFGRLDGITPGEALDIFEDAGWL